LKRLAFFIILAQIILSSAYAGRRDTIPIIHFQLVDATNGKPIPLAHIVNINTKKATIADMLGYFRIPIAVGDTLTVTAVGFHDMKIPSWGQFSLDSLYFPIRLTPRFYEIKEVKITRFGSYQRFIREVASMEMPKSEDEIMQERLEDYFRRSITQMDLKNLPSPSGGFFFGDDWLTRQRQKIESKRIEEQKWDIILKKFSAKIVCDLTGLEGIEAIKFMEYCGFTEGYLLISSDYEVRKMILDKFDVYKNK
jgi:hypothetical protein